MKRRIIAALMALCLCIGLLPATALAAGDNSGTIGVTGDGPYTTADRNVEFFLYTTQLYKLLMLAVPGTDEATTINKVELLLTEGHWLYGSEIELTPVGVENRETDYRYLSITNTGHKIEPSNICGLRISYTHNGTSSSVKIQPESLNLYSEFGGAGATVDYTIQSSNNSKFIVAFYDNGDNAIGVNYSLYDAYIVDADSCLKDENIWPETPTYEAGLIDSYTFVNWDTYKGGGNPFLETSIIRGDTEVFSQKVNTDGENAGTEIHVMNRGDYLLNRFVDLYNAAKETQISTDDIKMDSVKITVYGENEDIFTNPNYNAGATPNRWEGKDNREWYLVQNLDADAEGLDYYEQYWNVHVNHSKIRKIVVSAELSDGTIGEVTINRGIKPGDFAVAVTSSTIIELHILQEGEVVGEPDLPDPEPGDDYAITDVTKTLVDTAAKAEAAGISGVYDYPDPDNGNKVIIPNEEGASVTLLYAITVTGKEGAAFTVTDTDADLVAGAEIAGDPADTFTGSIPDGGSITFYVSKTFTAADINGDGNLTNTATVAGENEDDADPDEDEDTEETPAEEDVTTIPLDVYVYLRVEGSGQNGELTDEDLATIAEWKLEKSNPDDYYILGKLSGVGLPEDILTDGELTYEKYATYIKQAFTDDKFTAYKWNSVIDEDFLNGIAWENLVWASGAPGYESETQEGNCLHLDGVLKLKSSYDLTYDANGGTIGGNKTHTVSNIPAAEAKDYQLDDKIVPTHSNDAVVFAGWTTDVDAKGKIYSVEDAKNGSVPAAVDAVDLTETKTVYALWSYDEDKDGTPDINEIIVTPADITIYTGGDSYTGEIVDSNGDPVTSGGEDETQDYNGFPEPGFYITLPTALNDQLRDGGDGPVNLSDELSFIYGDPEKPTRSWTLKMYNPASDANNIAYSKYIYQLAPAEGQDPVRLLIKDAAGNEQSSDRFTFGVGTLYQEYTMTIYGGGTVETGNVQAVIGSDPYSVFVDTGDLTVRGVKGEDSTSAVVTEKPEELDKITAVAADDVTYYINDSAIPVREDSEIHLLADELADTPQALTAAAEKAINGAIEDPEYDFMYLDLVDSSNGNAYVTLDGKETVTIHWPIPGDAKEGSAFYVVHFDGLDRDYDVTDLDDLLNNPENPDKVQVITYTKTDDSLKVSKDGKSVSFETSTFSPFALVYETKTTPPQETVTVTFKVVNGTWSNGSSSNIEVTVPKDGSLTTRQIPTGMKPNSGYEGGSWDTTPNTNRKLNSNVTYTYTFTKSGDTEPEDEDCILYFESNGGTEFQKIDNGNDSFRINPYSDSEYGPHIPSRPGYRFTGWYRDEDLENRISESTKINVNSIMTIYAGWERTSVPSMLNGDDHYAYIQGYADGTVRPNANITRAQVATIFFRLLDEDVRSDYLTTYNTFPDVNADYWANTAISTMASLGVINGRNSGLFDPDAYITRAEFAAICARFDDSNVSGFDSFTDTFGHWAEEEIGRAAALGWIQGYDDGTFRPNQYITRAQAVTMINRVLCRLPEDEDDLLPGMSIWTDCREGDWCYLAIQEATNSHDYVTKARVYETWTDLNRAPDWSRYE